MNNLYDMILEEGRIEYYKIKTKTKEENNTYNFIRINNLVEFICDFLRENNITTSYVSILDKLETTDTYYFSKNGIEVDCSLMIMNFIG